MPQTCAEANIHHHPKDITNLNYTSKHKRRIEKDLKRTIIKDKCNRFLLKKLKKYKRRKDGIEDPDVIDVSKSFCTSLNIRSPDHKNHEYLIENSEYQERKIKNYLFNMERKNHNQNKFTILNMTENNLEQNNKKNTYNNCEEKCTVPEINEHIKDIAECETNIDNKHVNAFQLLMSSRNKTIGSNSPGKDKSSDEFESDEMLTKKTLKLKRNSALLKMSEARGYHKHMEIEERKDEYVRKQMDRRKARLKKMLSTKKHKNHHEKKNRETTPDVIIQTKKTINNTLSPDRSEITHKEVRTIKTINNIPPKIENLCKDDEDFLNKLSPSIKKTENVMCYFKKIDKKCSVEDNLNECESHQKDKNIIKVKVISRGKHKVKRKKRLLSVNNNIENKSLSSISETNQNGKTTNNGIPVKDYSDKKNVASVNTFSDHSHTNQLSGKRKRKEDKDYKTVVIHDDMATNSNEIECRPKRNVKKPLKYSNECLSSEDELLIFTPKKKKHENKKSILNHTETIIIDDQNENRTNKNKTGKKKLSKEVIIKTNRNTVTKKIAPIFTKNQKDPVAIEAKQRFLQSGMPDQIKKNIPKQSDININANSYPITKHIRQNDLQDRHIEKEIELLPFNIDECTFDYSKFDFTSLLDLTQRNDTHFKSLFSNNVQKTLYYIKERYPRFPVFRTYQTLKNRYLLCKDNFNEDESCETSNDVLVEKFDELKSLNWSERYRPKTTKDIIGNFEPIKELKKWLTTWKENEIKAKTMTNHNDSDASDFYNSDTDSRGSERSGNNLIIVTGPVGCGKTSCVYAAASELAMKVIEVNASGRRTGKIMLQDLQEATQSHKVDRTKGTNSDNSQNSQEVVTGCPKKHRIASRIKLTRTKSLNCENVETSPQNRTEMSLILIDDADIVFEQDDGFSTALSHIVQCSKRPVVIVTTTLNSSHLQKYLIHVNVLKMNRLMPRMLGTWLDILCLADCGECSPGLGAKFLEYFRGDMRKSINAMQFLFSSQPPVNATNVIEDKALSNLDVEDESSSMSWTNLDDNVQPQSLNSFNIVSNLFNSDISSLDTIQSSCTVGNLSLWWSLLHSTKTDIDDVSSDRLENSKGLKSSVIELNSLASAIDSFSLSDMLMNKMKLNTKKHISSDPWVTQEYDSVSERENMDGYSRCCELGYEMCSEFAKDSTSQVYRTSERVSHSGVSEMTLEREKEKLIDRHHELTRSFSISTALDRRALATDYWAACRTICRLEKDKIDNNTKRKNRYCHYLKTLKVTCNNDSYLKLCDSLSSEKKEE